MFQGTKLLAQPAARPKVHQTESFIIRCLSVEVIMLPEFRRLKLDLDRDIKHNMQAAARGRGTLSDIHQSVVHEGDRFTLHREDGSVETKFYHALEASVELSPEDIQSEGAKKVAEAVDNLAEQLAEQEHHKFFETITSVIRSVGNEVDAGGRPFTAEIWLDVLEKMELSFDDDGTWRPPTVVLHPTMLSRAQNELGRLETDSVLKQRLDDIVSRQRDEWRVRESNRKLVD